MFKHCLFIHQISSRKFQHIIQKVVKVDKYQKWITKMNRKWIDTDVSELSDFLLIFVSVRWFSIVVIYLKEQCINANVFYLIHCIDFQEKLWNVLLSMFPILQLLNLKLWDYTMYFEFFNAVQLYDVVNSLLFYNLKLVSRLNAYFQLYIRHLCFMSDSSYFLDLHLSCSIARQD